MRTSTRLAPLLALAGAGCAGSQGPAAELKACDIVSIPDRGIPISHDSFSYDDAGGLVRRVCDGCDRGGMDGIPDEIDEVTRDGGGNEATTTVSRSDGNPSFSQSETTTDAQGCPVERRFWRGTPQDWAVDRVTCDEGSRKAQTEEDLGLGAAPGRRRTLTYDRHGRLIEELFDRDIDGAFEERTRWRYGRWRLPIRRDWYLNDTLLARSDYQRTAEGALIVEAYDYLVDGRIEVRRLYGYGCGAP